MPTFIDFLKGRFFINPLGRRSREEFLKLIYLSSRVVPPDKPSLAIKRMKNVILSYLNWKFGLSFEVSPCILQLEPVRGCNLNCVMCRAGELKKEFMSFDEFKKVLDTLPEVLIIVMNFAGEPFLSKETMKMIRYASFERKILVNIFSNFTVLPDPNDVINSGLYEIHASIDTFNPDKFRKIRVNGDLGKITDNLRKLVKKKKELRKIFPIISINAVSSKETIEDAEDIIKNGIEIGVDRVKFQRILYNTPELTIPDEDDFKYLMALKRKYRGKMEVVVNNFPWGGDYAPGYCYLAYFMTMVDVKGNLFPCCMTYAFFEPDKSSLGNIFENGRGFIKRRKKFIREFRKEAPSFCKICPIYFRN